MWDYDDHSTYHDHCKELISNERDPNVHVQFCPLFSDQFFFFLIGTAEAHIILC